MVTIMKPLIESVIVLVTSQSVDKKLRHILADSGYTWKTGHNLKECGVYPELQSKPMAITIHKDNKVVTYSSIDNTNEYIAHHPTNVISFPLFKEYFLTTVDKSQHYHYLDKK